MTLRLGVRVAAVVVVSLCACGTPPGGGTGGGTGSTAGGTGGTAGGQGTAGGTGGTAGGQATAGGSGGTAGGQATAGGSGGTAGGQATAGGSGGTAGGQATAGGSGGTAGGQATAGGSGGTAGGSTACAPQTVNVSTTGCGALPTPGACGGALTGRYCYTGFCVDQSQLFATQQAACGGAGGTFTFTNVAGTVNGTLDFTGTGATGGVQRNATLTITGNLAITPQCAPTGCAGLQTVLSTGGATVTCTGAGACSCAFTYVVPAGAVTTFSTSGGVVTTGSGGSQRTYQYCVQGSALRYRETTTSPAEPGVATLGR